MESPEWTPVRSTSSMMPGTNTSVPVADGVDLHLLAPNVFVHQHGLVLVDLHGGFQVMAQLLLVGDDLHGAAAQHEAGTHQHGIADLVGRRDAVLDVGDGLALGLGDVQLLQKLFKGVPVFGSCRWPRSRCR